MTLTATIGYASSLSKQASLFKSLTGSLAIAGTETKGLATSLTATLGPSSKFAEQNSFVRSLAGSLSSGSGLGEQLSLSRFLNGSLTINSRFAKGSIENLRSHLGTPSVLSGHYDCHETLVSNCGTVSASFAYLVVAVGAVLFAVYSMRLRRRAPGLPEELRPEDVAVDKEGWETKASKKKGKKQAKDSKDNAESTKKESDEWSAGP